ncbi:MAG: hypothetical protein M3Z33_06230 [Actinomycetota bacterium]|nr:hypothetical protein [Actinomycetota bacterium]
MSRFTGVLIALAIVAALAASPAAAQDAPAQGYSTPAGQVQAEVNSGDTGQADGPRRVSKAASSHLPFTGFDLGLLLAVGLGLVLVGAGLSRLGTPASERRRS